MSTFALGADKAIYLLERAVTIESNGQSIGGGEPFHSDSAFSRVRTVFLFAKTRVNSCENLSSVEAAAVGDDRLKRHSERGKGLRA